MKPFLADDGGKITGFITHGKTTFSASRKNGVQSMFSPQWDSFVTFSCKCLYLYCIKSELFSFLKLNTKKKKRQLLPPAPHNRNGFRMMYTSPYVQLVAHLLIYYTGLGHIQMTLTSVLPLSMMEEYQV